MEMYFLNVDIHSENWNNEQKKKQINIDPAVVANKSIKNKWGEIIDWPRFDH